MNSEEMWDLVNENLTLDNFITWVELTKLDTFKVGQASYCPIAKFMQSWYPENPETIGVGVTHFIVDSDSYSLPNWATMFVRAYDTKFHGVRETDYSDVLNLIHTYKELLLENQAKDNERKIGT